MCGLIALFGTDAGNQSGLVQALQRMHRRGPDGEGLWHEPGVALGHRRLAILDLDERAAQPMHSSCGRFVIVFNGEIYNFRDLKADLERDGVVFRTSSDTEVLLTLFAREGERMLPKLHGMFAFVIWDRQTRKAFVARDPYGIKPLYVGVADSGLVLASQVKAILATGLVSRQPCARGQVGFWMLGSVPEPHTWYRDIRALPSGAAAWIEDGRIVRQWSWHDLGAAWRNAEANATRTADVQAAVRDALQESIRRHLVADVPVGVFLSGGIDSGVLAGMMVEAGAQDLVGVTLAYDEFAGRHEDEAPAAAQLAKHYGIRHHVRRVGQQEFLSDLPRILDAMDQPSIDGINTWYASKAVAELGLKVVVSGVGGDELFQGYPSFQQLPKLVSRWRLARTIPGVGAVAGAVAVLQSRRTGNARWRHAPDWLSSMAGAWWLRRSVNAPEALSALMDPALASEGLRGFDPDTWVHAMTGTLPADPMLALGQIESMTYLRNQLLRDSDWASMDHSVELRTPLVDSHLLELVRAQLASFVQYPGKQLLAGAPDKSLPSDVLLRRKTGFGIPIYRWLGVQSKERTISKASSTWARRVIGAYEDGGATQ